MSTNPLPPWMIAENFGEHTGTPSSAGPQPMPPGFPAGLWIDVTPAPTTPPTTPSSTPAPSPAPNPQIGVETLPPANSSDPAPLPGAVVPPGFPFDTGEELPPALQRELRTRPDQLEWEYRDGGQVLVGPEDEGEFVWGYFPPEGDFPGGWETLDPGEWPMGPDNLPRGMNLVDGRAVQPDAFAGPLIPAILRAIIVRALRTRRVPQRDRQRQQQQQRERQQQRARRRIFEELMRQRVPDPQPLEVPEPRELRPPRLPAPQPEPLEVPEPYRMPQPVPTAPAPVPVFTPEIAWPPMTPPSPVATPGTTRVGRPQRARQRIPVAWPLAFGLANLLGRSARQQRLQLFDGIQPGPGTSPGTTPGGSVVPDVPGFQPELAQSLTSLNARGVESQQQRCKPCKKPAKKRRNPSSVVATVKPFKRRMSRNSLNNLKGKSR